MTPSLAANPAGRTWPPDVGMPGRQAKSGSTRKCAIISPETSRSGRDHRRDAWPRSVPARPSPQEPAVAVAAGRARPHLPSADTHPIVSLVLRRLAAGIITLLVVSVV